MGVIVESDWEPTAPAPKKPKKRAGKFPDEEQWEFLCKAARDGYSLSGCAANADLSYHTLDRWLKKGRPLVERLHDGEQLTEEEERFAVFADEFDCARARGVRKLENLATRRANDGMGTWQEAITKLERGHREEWGRTSQHTGPSGPTVIVIEARPDRLELTDVIDGRVAVGGTEDQRALPSAPAPAGVPQ